MSISMSKPIKSIAIILGSTRQPRACPQIAAFVADIIRSHANASTIYLHTIDLKDWNLPMFDEPGIPSRIYNSDDYEHEHTRAWSREVARHDAYIFVTPQYNWGYPAVLKNAIDYLFNEWKSKPAMIVSYGGHGGSKCNAQLRQVLEGIDMQVTATSVELSFGSKAVTVKAATGQELGLDAHAEQGLWSSERASILFAYDELVQLLQ